jgi:hypothetical protein
VPLIAKVGLPFVIYMRRFELTLAGFVDPEEPDV